jgi:hypothetical protein
LRLRNPSRLVLRMCAGFSIMRMNGYDIVSYKLAQCP